MMLFGPSFFGKWVVSGIVGCCGCCGHCGCGHSHCSCKVVAVVNGSIIKGGGGGGVCM